MMRGLDLNCHCQEQAEPSTGVCPAQKYGSKCTGLCSKRLATHNNIGYCGPGVNEAESMLKKPTTKIGIELDGRPPICTESDVRKGLKIGIVDKVLFLYSNKERVEKDQSAAVAVSKLKERNDDKMHLHRFHRPLQVRTRHPAFPLRVACPISSHWQGCSHFLQRSLAKPALHPDQWQFLGSWYSFQGFFG